MQKEMTMADKERRIQKVKTGLAFGGKALSSDMEKELMVVMDGEKTSDQLIQELIEKYKK